jgi:hypothetical protein
MEMSKTLRVNGREEDDDGGGDMSGWWWWSEAHWHGFWVNDTAFKFKFQITKIR